MNAGTSPAILFACSVRTNRRESRAELTEAVRRSRELTGRTQQLGASSSTRSDDLSVPKATQEGTRFRRLCPFHRIYTLVEIARVLIFAQMTTATQTGKEHQALNLWEKFLERVRSRVSINTYSTWFQPTRLSRAEADVVHVQIPNTVFRQVLTRTYGEIVKAVFLCERDAV